MSRFKQFRLPIFLLCSFSLLIFTQATSDHDFLDALEKLVNEKKSTVNGQLRCTGFEFKCKDNSKCLQKDSFCNRIKDCPDGSDEYPDCTIMKLCQSYEFHCDNDYCVSNSQVCDGVDDCQDNSDEVSCEANHCTKNAHLCDQLCIVNGTSYECQCKPGYELQLDKKTCKALDSYGDALLLYSTSNAIKAANISTINNTKEFVTGLTEAIAIEMDALHVYWADWINERTDNAIFRSIIGVNEHKPFVMSGVGYVEEIAVDWITNNVYYIDSLKKIFGVCNSSGKFCTAVLQGDHLYPSSLALNPLSGEMFWSEWSGSVLGYIGKSKMNGDARSILVKYNIVHPSAITIDHPKQRLYWVDLSLQHIESVNLDGTGRHKITPTKNMMIHSLAVMEDRLYWSDFRWKTINSCNKFTCADRKILLNETDRIASMLIHHPLLKPDMQNPCKLSSCSELCLLAGDNNYTCACRLDRELDEDGHSCRARKDKEYLIATTNSFYLNYYGSYIGHPDSFRFNRSFPHFTATAYDSQNHGFYLNDKESSRVFYYNLHSNHLKIIEGINNQQISGMSFDFISNSLYWCNTVVKSIDVFNVESKQHKTWRFKDTPVNILVIPEYGTMIVAFCNSKCRIDKFTMSGRFIENVVVENEILGPKISLTFDYSSNEIIWADEGTGNMECISIYGKNRRRIHTGLLGPVSIAIFKGRVYWTIRDSTAIYSSMTKRSRAFLPVNRAALSDENSASVIHLIATRDNKNEIDHECKTLSNGYCSHLCLVGYTDDYECACPNGLVLKDNKKSCGVPLPCEGHVYRCLDNSCIDISKKCDGIVDCLDRDDEANCQKLNSTCFKDEFQCGNGKCLSKNNVCNGENDCGDFTDETNCPFRICSDPTDFKCKSPSGFCIPHSWQCDGAYDCDDGSDEANCEEDKCPIGMTRCQNGVCIDSGLLCDGIDDCGDNTDEYACYDHSNLVKPTNHCNVDEYRCINSDKCIPILSRCNMNRDCPKGDDEDSCYGCDSHLFTCNNLRCVQNNRVCDGKNDCGDNSDEELCDKEKRMSKSINLYSKTPVTKIEKTSIRYTCATGQSLYYSQVCDGEVNCRDGSDEGGSCNITCTSQYCDHHCEQTPNGPQCICMSGYKLLADNKTCVNIDECTLDGICSQICVDTKGKYRCDCIAGFYLKSDGRTCKSSDNTTIVFTATQYDIREISNNFQMINVITKTASSISGMDINVKDKLLFWSDEKSGTITEYQWEDQKHRIISNKGKPNLIAVDWVTNNIYFVNNEKPYAIMACTRDEQKCSFIVRLKDEGNVTSLTVDPINGFIFWAQVTLSNRDSLGKIYRSDMNGENIIVISNNKTGLVSGIAVHHVDSKLFWVDRSQERIVKSDLDGSNRSVFRHVHQPLTINIYEDSIYWIMGSTRTVFSCPLYDAIPCQPVPIQSSNVEDFLVISHITRQPYAMNYCAKMKCDWMCTNKNESAKCMCLDGKIPTSNSPNCQNIPDNTNPNVPANKNDGNIPQHHLMGMVIVGIMFAFFIVFLAMLCFFCRKLIFRRFYSVRPLNVLYHARRASASSSDHNDPDLPIFPDEEVPDIDPGPRVHLQEFSTFNNPT
ncbi:hypothetical protein PV327_003563 [Microctonus hyperodae]|uniref:EGF-like domain-containing protein n=1 Tax=Microctonus hyperodae TaxID=165561 RepID=A0AA39L159_MICHY|nr:hypothetical protein PV327_003563 [Microctonus hyperodae]